MREKYSVHLIVLDLLTLVLYKYKEQKIMKLFIMQFLPFSRYFLFLELKSSS
jgi:hypothetical protein